MNMIVFTTAVLLYLLVVVYLGYRGYRETKTAADYLLAGRDVHPLVMSLSYGSTFISTSAIVGFGGAAAVYGMGLLYLTFLNIFFGIFIAFVFFGKRTRRMGLNLNAHTFPEFLGNRFNSRFLQGASGLIIFIFMPLYAGVVLMGGAQFVAQAFGIPYNTALFFFTAIIGIYVIMGGLKGVMYTDAFQGLLMLLGMTFLLVFTYVKLGGVIDAHRALTAMKDLVPPPLAAKGHNGWTSFPPFGTENWWVLTTSIILGVGIGVLAQPQLVVRFMTVKSDRDLNRAVPAGGFFIFMMTGVAFIVGALSNVYFVNNPAFGKIAFLAAGKNVDNIIPLYITSALPHWFTAVFMITLLAAAMSTLSSQFHVAGTAAGRDVWEKWIKGKGGTILITKVGILVSITAAFLLAWALPNFFEEGTAIIARGTAIFFGLCATAFLPMFIGSLYSRSINKTAAVSGFIAGFSVALFMTLFIHTKESAPLLLCNALFGKASLALGSKWEFVDPLVVALPVSALTTLLANNFGKRLPPKHVENCFEGIR
ncbi:MAG: sodium:solute symporter family protein [bacterium]|nr:sodium:solute symporter family protein [bacterium]